LQKRFNNNKKHIEKSNKTLEKEKENNDDCCVSKDVIPTIFPSNINLDQKSLDNTIDTNKENNTDDVSNLCYQSDIKKDLKPKITKFHFNRGF